MRNSPSPNFCVTEKFPTVFTSKKCLVNELSPSPIFNWRTRRGGRAILKPRAMDRCIHWHVAPVVESAPQRFGANHYHSSGPGPQRLWIEVLTCGHEKGLNISWNMICIKRFEDPATLVGAGAGGRHLNHFEIRCVWRYSFYCFIPGAFSHCLVSKLVLRSALLSFMLVLKISLHTSFNFDEICQGQDIIGQS